MRKITYSTIAFLGAISAAQAAEIPGEWRVEDGVATIRIVDCNSHLWGVVATEKTPGGIDEKNPDKAKRSRPTLGMPILLDMKKDQDDKGKWSGNIYNAKDGKTYEASIQLSSANQLKVEGCVLGFLCGGQTWTRVPDATPPVTGNPAAKTMAAHPGAKPVPPVVGTPKTVGQKGAALEPAAAVSDVCLLPDVARAPH